MREHGVFKDGIRQLAHHRDLNLGHDFASFDTQDGGPKIWPVFLSTMTFMSRASRPLPTRAQRNSSAFCNANLDDFVRGFRFGNRLGRAAGHEHSVRRRARR